MKNVLILIIFLVNTVAFSQTLTLFDVDATNFPTIRGKFFAFDGQGQRLRPSISELAITENGLPRTITNVSCPPQTQVRLSVVLLVDVTIYNDINNTKSVLNSWVNQLGVGENEVALVTYDGNSYINQDFTTDRTRLQNSINALQTLSSSEDHDGALQRATTGGIAVAEKGRFKKVVLLLSSCSHFTQNQIQPIINRANQSNVSLNFVIFDRYDWTPNLTMLMALGSGGFSMNKIPYNDIQTAQNALSKIYQVAQGGEACTVEWTSAVRCGSSGSTAVELRFVPQNLTARASYQAPATSLARLEFAPIPMRFENPPIGVPQTQTLTITAKNSAFTVNNISSSNPTFTVNPTNFTLQPNQSQAISVTYTAVDSGFTFTRLTIENDICDQTFFVSGGYRGKKPTVQTLKLAFPNGGESFVVGSDTLIRWDGIPATELVRLEYSTNNGSTWNNIDTARGLSYVWKRIPRRIASQCLVKVQQISSNNNVRTLSGHAAEVFGIAFSPDGSTIASGSWDGIIKLWDVTTGQELRTHDWGSSVYSVAFSPDGSTLASMLFFNIKLWDVTTGQELRTLSGHTQWVESIAFSPDGSTLASGSRDNTIKLWDVTTGQELRTLSGHTHFVDGVAFSPDGSTIASGSWDRTIKLWDVTTGQQLRTLSGHAAEVRGIAFSPDGSTIASGSSDGTIKLWDVTTGQELRTLGHTSTHHVKFSPDGSTLASSSIFNRFIKLWDVTTGQELRTLLGHTKPVESIAFSPDGSTLASGSRDSTIKLWDVDVTPLQSDQSDDVFSIVEPLPASQNITMGEVHRGTNKDSVVVDFVRNTSTWRFDVDSMYFRGADSGSFSLVSGSPPYTIEANSSHFGEFRFTPSRVGLHSAEIVIITQSDTLVQTITGIGVEQSIEVIGQLIDFGVVNVGSIKDTLQSVTIRNSGSIPITITDTRHSLPNATDFTTITGGGSFTLAPNETRLMDLRFTAREVGRTSGTLKFAYNGVGSPAVVQLFGEGIRTTPSIQADITTFTDLLCDTVGNTDIVITNTGGADLVISNIQVVGSNSTEFIVPTTTPLTVAPDSTIRLPISFRPQTAGTKTAVVQFFSNAEPDSLFVIPVTAKKDVVTLQTASSIDIGVVCPNTDTTVQVSINNIGSIASMVYLQADAGIQLSTDSIQVPIGSTTNVDVMIAGISQEGAFSRTIRITDRCGVERVVTVTGTVETPQLQVNDVTISTLVGSSIDEKITITNPSTRPITITGVNGIVAPFAVVGSPFPLTIAPQGSAEIDIQYTPVDTNPVVQTIQLTGNPCTINQNVQLTGVAMTAGLIVRVLNTEAFPGDEVEIPIILTDAQNLVQAGVTSIDGTLRFNPSILYPKGYTVTAVNDTAATINVTNISVTNPAGIPAIRIPFVAMLGNADSSTILLEQVLPQGGNASITIFNGVFKLLGICREGGSRLVFDNAVPYLLMVTPNPSDGNVDVDVNVIEDGTTTLKIFNANGSLMEEHRFNTLGSKKLAIDTKGYSNGLYFITLQTPTTFDKTKLLLVK